MPRSRPSDLWPWSDPPMGAPRNPGGGDCSPITCSTTTHHPPRCPNDNPKKRVFLPRFDQHTGWGKVPIRPPGGRAVGPRVSGAMSCWVYVVCHADPPFSTLCLSSPFYRGVYMPTASIRFPPSHLCSSERKIQIIFAHLFRIHAIITHPCHLLTPTLTSDVYMNCIV